MHAQGGDSQNGHELLAEMKSRYAAAARARCAAHSQSVCSPEVYELNSCYGKLPCVRDLRNRCNAQRAHCEVINLCPPGSHASGRARISHAAEFILRDAPANIGLDPHSRENVGQSITSPE